MDLLRLLVMYFKCSPKFNLSSTKILRCFWYGVWFTGILLKINTGWFGFLILREKNDFLSLLRRIRVKTNFPLISSAFYLKQVIISSFTDVFLSWKTEQNEVSSAKSLGIDDKLVDRSLNLMGLQHSLLPIRKFIRLELLFDIYLKGSLQ